MSYIIAHVAFKEHGRSYPVNCLRTDIKIGDNVIVKIKNQLLKKAQVVDVNYLNWSCQNTIECLVDESYIAENGIIHPCQKGSSIKGLARSDDLAISLYKSGWIPRRSSIKKYKSAYSFTNDTQTALILMYDDGIDVQIIDNLSGKDALPNSLLTINKNIAPIIRQNFHGSRFNILERTNSFAKGFLRNKNEIAHKIAPLNTEKKLPVRPRRRNTSSDWDDLGDLYSALGGSDGQPVYLSDGLWVTPSGGIRDWGR